MKNYTITVNGSVYNVTVEEGAGTGVATPVAAPIPAAWSRCPPRPPGQTGGKNH